MLDEHHETVVLLHGIGQIPQALLLLQRRLKKEGYKVINIPYPSLTKSIEQISGALSEGQLDQGFWVSHSKVHFVTHSMGGLVAACYLELNKSWIPREKIGRVVMVAPPHGGSEVADFLCDLPLYKWVFGPAGQQLTTQHQSKVQSDIFYELGIIAGRLEWPFTLSSYLIPTASDGRVSVESTKLPDMADHVSVKGSHTLMVNKKEVHDLIVSFLKEGHFFQCNRS